MPMKWPGYAPTSRLNARTLLTLITTKDNASPQATARQIITLILSQKAVNWLAQMHHTLEIVTQLHAWLCVRKYLNNTLRVVIVWILVPDQDSRISKTKENVISTAVELRLLFLETETTGNVSFQPTVPLANSLTTWPFSVSLHALALYRSETRSLVNAFQIVLTITTATGPLICVSKPVQMLQYDTPTTSLETVNPSVQHPLGEQTHPRLPDAKTSVLQDPLPKMEFAFVFSIVEQAFMVTLWPEGVTLTRKAVLKVTTEIQ